MGRLASHHFSISTPSHSSFYIAALLLTCAIRTTLGAYRQVSPGSAWTRLRSHGRVGGALHRKQAQRRSCRRQHSAEEYGPDGGSVRGGQVSPRHRGGLLAARPRGPAGALPEGAFRCGTGIDPGALPEGDFGAMTTSHGMEEDSIPPHDRIDISRAQRSFDRTET